MRHFQARKVYGKSPALHAFKPHVNHSFPGSPEITGELQLERLQREHGTVSAESNDGIDQADRADAHKEKLEKARRADLRNFLEKQWTDRELVGRKKTPSVLPEQAPVDAKPEFAFV